MGNRTTNDVKKKQVVLVYNVLRVIAILLVVLGHSDFLNSYGFDVTNIISPSLESVKIEYKFIREWIYSFHMPLFFILSGAVFQLSCSTESFKIYFMKRVRRLLIPFFMCGIFFSVPIKYLVGYYDGSNIIVAYIKSLLLMLTPGHLWFLWVTFVINILMFSFRKKLWKNYKLFLFVCLILYIISFYYRVEVFQIYRICRYPLFFYAGYLMELKGIREKIESHYCCITIISLIISIIMLPITQSILNSNIMIIYALFTLVQALVGSVFLLGFSYILLYKTNILERTMYKSLYKHNFEIYLYHEPLSFLIVWLMNYFNILKLFNGNLGYVLLCIIRFCCSLFFSIWIAEFVHYILYKCKNQNKKEG